MASIKTNDKQEKALKELNSNLQIMQNSYAILNNGQTCELTILFEAKSKKGRGKTAKIVLSPAEKEASDVLKAIEKYHQRLAKEMVALAKANSLQFDDDELAILELRKSPAQAVESPEREETPQQNEPAGGRPSSYLTEEEEAQLRQDGEGEDPLP